MVSRRSHRIAAARLRARRPKVKRARPSRRRLLLMAVAAAIAVWGTIAFVEQYARTYAIAREAATLDQRRETLIAQNERLREEIQRLKTDNSYIEHLARAELGLVRPGEIEYMIVPRGSSPAAPQPGARPGGTTPAGDRPATDAPRSWFDRLILHAASLLASLHR